MTRTFWMLAAAGVGMAAGVSACRDESGPMTDNDPLTRGWRYNERGERVHGASATDWYGQTWDGYYQNGAYSGERSNTDRSREFREGADHRPVYDRLDPALNRERYTDTSWHETWPGVHAPNGGLPPLNAGRWGPAGRWEKSWGADSWDPRSVTMMPEAQWPADVRAGYARQFPNLPLEVTGRGIWKGAEGYTGEVQSNGRRYQIITDSHGNVVAMRRVD